jgi:hypothetical protein
MSFTSFGQVIPVLGQNIGFPGTVSRAGVPVIVSRQLLSTTTNKASFGDPVVLIADATGGTFQSIKDFAATAANTPNVASKFAGVAVREVKTQLTYPAGVTPGTQQTGYYSPGQIMDALELGSIVVVITHGTPSAGGAVYARIVANASLTGTAVGDLEAAADTVSTTGTAASGTSVTVADGTGIAVGQLVTGAGVAAGTYVSAVSGTTVTFSAAVTAALSATPLVFANTVVLPNTEFRTGYLDANGIAEITILRRNHA